VHEPLIIYLTALLSLAYFVFFGFLEALPVIYGDIHGLELYQVGLCFIPIFIGAGIATILALPMARAYEKEARSGIMPPPERRLIPLIVGGFVLPISLFWQGWAGYKSSSEQGCLLNSLHLKTDSNRKFPSQHLGVTASRVRCRLQHCL